MTRLLRETLPHLALDGELQEAILDYLEEHERYETALRHTCPECWFETGELDRTESHTSNCSRRPTP